MKNLKLILLVLLFIVGIFLISILSIVFIKPFTTTIIYHIIIGTIGLFYGFLFYKFIIKKISI